MDQIKATIYTFLQNKISCENPLSQKLQLKCKKTTFWLKMQNFFSLLVDLNEFFSLDEVCWTVEIFFCAVRRQWRCCCRHRRHRRHHRRCRHRDSVEKKLCEKRMVTHVWIKDLYLREWMPWTHSLQTSGIWCFVPRQCYDYFFSSSFFHADSVWLVWKKFEAWTSWSIADCTNH